MIGQRLAHYQITALIGKGGMGEVYRARDTKLDRDVAVKVLSADMSDDDERIARFRREARALATLQHANIASIYGFEDSPEARFLVMEAVDGEDLAVRLRRGALDPDDALEFARQIATGLEAAHDQGIVHRDLKPANVMVTPQGQIKILDFGLARAYQGDAVDEGDLSNSPTVTAAVTGAGTLLGTAAYMSPEQARGHAVDQRTDIWAFGVILFEMLTGNRLFDGDTVSDKLASILKTEPAWETLPPSTPPRIRELLERCLAKRRRHRMKDIGDVRLEIEWIQQGKTGTEDVGPSAGRRVRLVPALIGAVMLATLAGLATWTLRPDGPDSARPASEGVPRRLSLQFPADLDVDDWLVARDGSVVISARPLDSGSAEGDALQLYVRELDRFDFQPIPGSARVSAFCFSYDSNWIAWLSPDPATSSGRYLWKMPVDRSSPALRVMTWRGEWRPSIIGLPRGDFLTVTYNRELLRIPSDGSAPGVPVQIRAEDFEDPFVPGPSSNTVLPDGVHVFDTVEVWTQDGYSRQIAVANLNTGAARLVVPNGDHPNYLDSGHLLFSRGPTLLAVRFDPNTVTTVGEPVAVADGLRTRSAWNHGEFGISAGGDLYHVPGGIVGQQRQLHWVDASDFTRFEPWSEERRAFETSLCISPDGRHLALIIADPSGLYEVWVTDLKRPAFRRFAFEEGRDCTPIAWWPDGTRLVYASMVPDDYRLMSAPVDGPDSSTLLFHSAGTSPTYDGFNPASFADGGTALILGRRSQGRYEVVYLKLGEGPEDEEPKVLLTGASLAQLSPDGEWLVYEADTSGRLQVYLRRWLGGGDLGPEIPVSLTGGSNPMWYRKGDQAPPEIWYTDQAQIHAVVMESSAGPTLSRPRLVVERNEAIVDVEVAPDGRFLTLVKGDDEAEPGRLNVILNWK